jgi:thymidylate synthase (FAD)
MGERIKVGPDGFVELVEHMGSDASICESARVSYDQTGKQGDDRKLIRYLMRHNHTSPFEMAELKFIVRVPLDIWRQWVRHRTASINEYSTRYREAINSVAIPQSDEWRLQSTTNKQGSEGQLPELDARRCSHEFASASGACLRAYERMIGLGVAREQARSVLQLANYTEAYWKIDLHNLLHFLHLRMAPEAQQEIREYANAIHDLINPLFPLTMQAFGHYRLGAMQLTALDIMAISERDWAGETIEDARERREYLQKLQALKLGRVCNEIHE